MNYFFQKLPIAALTLVLVATLCFVLTKAAGEEAAFGEKNPSPEVRAAIAKEWGLDRPMHEQYIMHMKKLLVLDSMPSRKQKGKSLRDILQTHLPSSLSLGFRALIFAVMFGVPIGMTCAVYHNRIIDNSGTLLALMGVSVPGFILASFAIFFLSRQWHIGSFSFGPMPAIGWDRPSPMIVDRLGPGTPALVRGVLTEIAKFRLWIPAASERAGRPVDVVEAALAGTDGAALLDDGPPGNAGGRRVGGEGRPVRAIAYTTLLDEVGLPRFDVAKFDLEGHDAAVLDAMIAAVPSDRWPRAIVVEHPVDRERAGDLRDRLTSVGYVVRRASKLNLTAERGGP